MPKKLTALAAILLCFPIVLVAQAAPGARPSAAERGAPPELKRIASLVGDWNLSSEVTPAPGQPTVTLKTTSRIVPILGGAHLQETVSVPLVGGGSNATIALWSYDRYRKTYRMAYLDERFALFDINEGNWDGDRLVLTNLRANTTFPVGGKQAHSRIMIRDLTPNRFLLEVAVSTDAGETWVHLLTATYTRR